MENVVAVVLAAGESRRMKSNLSKLLYPVGGKTLVELPVQACFDAGVEKVIVVVGHQAEKVKKVLKERCIYVYQERRLGTGDALKKASFLIEDFKGELLVLPGDAPFVTGDVLKRLLDCHRRKKVCATVLTAILEEPGSYGRILRDGQGFVKGVVEAKNATEEELKIKEVNSGIYCFDNQKIIKVLPELKKNNLTGEFYLTDVFEIFYRMGEKVQALMVEDKNVVLGINTPEDFEKVSRLYTQRNEKVGQG